MTLAAYRKSLNLSQEECARALGLASKGYISEIEGGREPSLKLALKIEQWSRGKVTAASLCPTAANILTKPRRAAADRTQQGEAA